MKLKKGSAEAKRFMASIRAKKKGAKKTAVKKTAVKKAPKKTAVKKASTHKDTKSHNVKISVVSGLQNNTLKEIKDTLADIESMNKQIILLQNDIKNYKPNQKGQISKWQLRQYLAVAKSYKKDNERHLNRLKKLL
jgi:hypothetical protein